MEVVEHEHPLTLIDLQVQYQQQQDVEEADEEEAGDAITKEVFHGVRCGRCGEEIHKYHRYYYRCMECDFSLHKLCGELSNRLDHPLHPKHPLMFKQLMYNERKCNICGSSDKYGELGYECENMGNLISPCLYWIDVKCALEVVGKNTIHHPCHPHLLTCLIPEPILCKCRACGKRHEGVFYQCPTCVGFAIHSECAFLPETLLIQQTTNNTFHHTHPLTISYSFPFPDQEAKHLPKCRVCRVGFKDTWYLWIYRCNNCMYYAHLDCATSRTKPAALVKNYKDADHPHLLHLPFPDETYSIPKHLFSQESGTSDYQVVNPLTHESHEHPLTLVDHTQKRTASSSSEVIDSWLLKCHDPMKKTQFLCNGCLRPITSTMPFYQCPQPICNFALHEWCTRLPHQIENHPAHPQHPLLLKYPNALPHHFFGVFHCNVCEFPCNGFAYCCVECGYYVDVTCGFLPKEVTHESHPDHLLLLVRLEDDKSCHMCLTYPHRGRLSFRCNSCDIIIDPECALLLPKAIRHKYDKHPMHLSYLPIENHKSQYFCEICEKDLNPWESFYHCQHCAQSVHAVCAPLILQCETETYWSSIYYFVNIKFGGIFDTNRHPHSLSFAQGTVLDGQCSKCGDKLQYLMILRCLECRIAICYYCCKRYYT